MPTKFILAGEEIANVLSASMAVNGRADRYSRRPAGSTRPGLLKVTKRSDKNLALLKWASKADKDSWKSGELVILDDNNQEVTKIRFSGAFVAEYREHVPDLDLRGDRTRAPVEEISISAQKIEINGLELANADWNVDE
jgi:hypothetical protein